MSKLTAFMRGLVGGDRARIAPPCPQDVTESGVTPAAINNQMLTSAPSSEFFFAANNAAGVEVTERSAMSISAVYSCVSLIAGAIGGLPLPIYRSTAGGRERIERHPLAALLNRAPSPLCTAAVFWEFLTSSLLLHGDAFARITRTSAFDPAVASLVPWHPSNVEVRRIDGRLKYRLTDPEIGGKSVIIDQDDMLHVPGIGFNGLRGMTPLSYALRSAAGIALAATEHTARFFGNGARPDFVLTTESNTLTEEQGAKIREAWNDMHGGPHRAYRPALLSGGLKIQPLTLNSVDAQLLATRNLQAEDVARIFGVPPHMIGLTDKTTSYGSGVEQMSIGFVKYTLMRHLTKFEQEINRKALRDTEVFAEFTTAGLERGDLKSRYDAHRTAIGRAGEPGFLTVNEVRRLENLPPVEGGDVINKGDTNAPPNV
ncbi:phage portal protein [Propionivibrio sp.]|uniref:phage portal protein n=1 Tax=Propionivibrio sp. TaxID=2212460 RepID=UPI00262B8252|nr:phage portal protein [Propionivibrio sp.]